MVVVVSEIDVVVLVVLVIDVVVVVSEIDVVVVVLVIFEPLSIMISNYQHTLARRQVLQGLDICFS